MELLNYVDGGYFTGAILTNLSPEVAGFSLPVKYPTGDNGAEFGFSMKKIPLTQGKFALVDDQDFEWLNQWKWYAHKSCRGATWYVDRSVTLEGKGTTMSMPSFILNTKRGVHIDHKNGNGLDNQRENIRFCTHSQNQWNQHRARGKSKYKGVVYCRPRDSWHAVIHVNKKTISLRYFKTEKAAAEAYDTAALKHFGEFACTNKMMGLL